MTENERVIIEATLEELKAAEDDLNRGVWHGRTKEILLAALGCFIEAREMYGEE